MFCLLLFCCYQTINREWCVAATSAIRHPTALSRTAPPSAPSARNSLPIDSILRFSLLNPIIGRNSFRQSLKTFLFAAYWCIQRFRAFTTMRCINRHFAYKYSTMSPSLTSVSCDLESWPAKLIVSCPYPADRLCQISSFVFDDRKFGNVRMDT